jgi:hypothetical protein
MNSATHYSSVGTCRTCVPYSHSDIDEGVDPRRRDVGSAALTRRRKKKRETEWTQRTSKHGLYSTNNLLEELENGFIYMHSTY